MATTRTQTTLFTQILTLTTGVCIYALIITPWNASAGLFIPLVIGYGTGFSRGMQIGMTLSLLCSLHTFDKRRDFAGLVLVIGKFLNSDLLILSYSCRVCE